MLTKFKFTFLAIPLVFFLSCSQKSKYCKITKSIIDGYPQASYYYNGDHLERIESYAYGTGLLQYTYVFYYDLQGRVDYMNRYNPDGTLAGRNEASYDGYGNLGAIYYLSDSDADGYPDATSGHYNFTHDSDGKLSIMDYYDATNFLVSSSTLTWSGDVISRIDYSSGGYDLFTYDSGHSRFGNILPEMFLYNTSYENLVNHNTTQIQHYNAADVLLSTDNYPITYNADGLPETLDAIFVLLGYEYQCEERE